MSNATERMAEGHQLLLIRESQAHMQNTAKQEHLQLWCELLGGLQTLVLGTFPTCEGIYWETNKQTHQYGFVF